MLFLMFIVFILFFFKIFIVILFFILDWYVINIFLFVLYLDICFNGIFLVFLWLKDWNLYGFLILMIIFVFLMFCYEMEFDLKRNIFLFFLYG